MPVEVGELVIRSKVISSDNSANTNSTTIHADSDDSSNTSMLNGTSSAGLGSDKDAIVQECVRQVLRILKKKEER